MSDERKADWAERIGRSLWRKSIGADLAEEGWIERIADALRRAEKRGYERGKTDGENVSEPKKLPGQVNQAIGAETNLERIQPSELSPATELKIRIFLWLGHGHDWVYGDDGEMQCCACPCDYKRDSLDECVEKARVASLETGLKALGRAASPTKEPAK